MAQKYDLVSVGDTTIDAFIKLHDASVHCDLNDHNCVLCISYADKVPYESLTIVPAVGNASNLAVGAARLGLRTAAFCAIGDDRHGREILDVYKREGVGRKFVKINPKQQTNYHFVLNFRAERTILIKHEAYEYFEPKRIGRRIPWIYFSSLGSHALIFHHKLAVFLGQNRQTKLGFNPGTFQLKLGYKKLAAVYRRSFILFVNREEAQRILQTRKSDIALLLRGLHKLGPKLVAITDGPKGAYGSDGKRQYYMPIYPDPRPPLERTGAGDAFSTGVLSALVYGLPFTEALRWGPVNSMSVVQDIGAQKGLLTKSRLLKLLKQAPKNFQPKLL